MGPKLTPRQPSPLAALGERARRAQDRELRDAISPTPDGRSPLVDTAVEQVLSASSGRMAPIRLPPARRASLRPAAVAACLALAAALVLLVVGAPRWGADTDTSTAFSVHGAHGVVGELIAARDGASLPLSFSDGSACELAPGGKVRVSGLDARGATLALESGAIDVSVVPRPEARWSVRAGPVEVRVTGTQFGVAWARQDGKLTVRMKKGTVEVHGPQGLLRRLSGQDVLEMRIEDARVAVVDPAPPEAAIGNAPAPAPPPPVAETSAPIASMASIAAGAPSGSHAVDKREPPEWRRLASEGKFKEALQSAERAGFSSMCESLPASDLRALADAARLGGSPARTSESLLAMRRRFPSNPDSAAAAFHLGRLASDQRGQPAEAARWFATYLAEQPRGTFALEAAGRLVEARSRAGDTAGAREAARTYLARFPDGSHAARAREILAAPTGATPAAP